MKDLTNDGENLLHLSTYNQDNPSVFKYFFDLNLFELKQKTTEGENMIQSACQISGLQVVKQLVELKIFDLNEKTRTE